MYLNLFTFLNQTFILAYLMQRKVKCREYCKESDSRLGTPCFVPNTVLQTNQLMVLSQEKYEQNVVFNYKL